ncbi:MAG: type IIL restriction-modification enzyme MmeI, partial [Verrucomicrobiota bacterium]
MKGGPFDLLDADGIKLLTTPNPHGKPNSDVLRLRVTAYDILRRGEAGWIIDFGVDRKPDECVGYEGPWKYATDFIKPVRESNRRKKMAEKWWIHGEARPGMRRKLDGLSRVLVTPEVSKHRIFVWLPTTFLPDHKLRAIAFDSDLWFGILHSHIHEAWALKQGSRLQTRPCYTPTTCFETFPFPFRDDLVEPAVNVEAELNAAKHYPHIVSREEPPLRNRDEERAAIADAAKELNELRERWLNPPEWTRTEYLEFPASEDGPWARYVECGGKRSVTLLSSAPGNQSTVAAAALSAQSKIGLARYPRLVAKDADCAAKLKQRTLTKLYNERPAWLDLAHKKL